MKNTHTEVAPPNSRQMHCLYGRWLTAVTIHSCTDLTSICVKACRPKKADMVELGHGACGLERCQLGRFAAGWRLKGGGGSCPARCRLGGGCGGWARNGASAVLRALSQRSDPAHDVQPGRRMALSLGRHGVSAVPQRWYRVGRSEETHARRATRDRHWD